MEVLYPRCAGLDVHQQTVVACARVASGSKVQQEVRTFGTATGDLLALADWLTTHGCTHVAMESTGVYWKPIWHVLDGQIELILANALQIRGVPGRKTDVNDAMWIADLLAHGLIRSSFVPPAAIHELRDLTRTRKQLMREVAQHTLRIQKVLEDANLKLTSVISDVMGMSDRAMIEAIIRGEQDAGRLADLSQGRLKASRPAVIAALQGRVTPHHRFLLRLHLTQIDALEVAVHEVEARLGEALAPFQAAVDRLMTIPAVGRTVARVIVAEIGFDMSRFPTAGHLVSCRALSALAGKRRQASLDADATWQSVAQNDARPSRLGGRPHAQHVPSRPVSSSQESARTQEGDSRGGRIHPDRGIPHFERRRGVPRTRCRLLRASRQSPYHPTSHSTSRSTRSVR
jgi:transposase